MRVSERMTDPGREGTMRSESMKPARMNFRSQARTSPIERSTLKMPFASVIGARAHVMTPIATQTPEMGRPVRASTTRPCRLMTLKGSTVGVGVGDGDGVGDGLAPPGLPPPPGPVPVEPLPPPPVPTPLATGVADGAAVGDAEGVGLTTT